MERMMPIDLERVDLRKRFRGYDRPQVDALLQRVADEWDLMHREMHAAREEIARLTACNQDYKAREDTLRDALLLAQKAADETRANARAEADRIVSDARRKAADDLRDLRQDIERLREERRDFETSYRHLLEACMAKLDRPPTLSVLEGEASSPIAAQIGL